MRHSIQNKAFCIFDMAKNIYIKTRHKPLSRFDPVTESQDSKEHTKHKQKKTLMSAFDLLCFLLITPLLIMALVQEFDTICASERRTTYLKRSKRDMRTCRVLTPRRRYNMRTKDNDRDSYKLSLDKNLILHLLQILLTP